MSAPPDLDAGFVIGSRYEIVSTLGKGGMGIVYKAYDRVLHETVAIKVLRPSQGDSPDMHQRFLGEIKLARSVTHRNVCRIHEYGEDGGIRYISMAFVDGRDLKQVLRERGPLPPAEAFDLAIAVADGLQAIHDEGIIHRDLKTPNLMIDGKSVVRLMDFGIAKQWGEGSKAGLTATGMIVGTPEYMSPEQVLGQKLDFRSDIYALGIVIYELFTGQTPFHSETPVGLLMKHLQEAPPLEGLPAARLPEALVPILSRALAKDKEARFASASELAEALREARGQSVGPRVAVAGGQVAGRAPDSGRQPATVRPLPTAVPAAGTTAHIQANPAAVPTAVPAVPSTTDQGRAVTWTPGEAVPPVGGAGRHGWAPYVAMSGIAAVATLVAVVLLQRKPASPPDAQVGRITVPTAPPSVAPSASPPRVSDGAAAATAAQPGSGAPKSAPTPGPPSAAVPPPSNAARAGSAMSPQVMAEVNGLLAEAESAFAAQQYSAALSFYDEALKLHPGNERARLGRELCASALARAAATPPKPARTFAGGRTEHSGGAASSGPSGFETTAGVAVRRVDAAAAAPGKVFFEVEPAAVKPGDRYTVKVLLMNEGAAPLALLDAAVETRVNGRRASGPVGLLVRSVPPKQRAVVFALEELWRAETSSWSMTFSVRTPRGETYRNTLEWR